MDKLKKWLKKQNIPYESSPEWSLIFSGNYPHGIYVDAKFADKVLKYRRYNKDFSCKWRGDYTSLYCY
jgi:hypothetical protein